MTATSAKYFIFTRIGRAVVSIERDVNEMDRASTVRDLIDGQVEDPTAVWCAEDNRFYDASEEIAQAIANEAAAHDIPLSQSLLGWMSNHVGLVASYRLGLEAA